MNSLPNHDLPHGCLDYCQLCGSVNLALVLDLGHQAPCDSLLNRDQLRREEVTYPLRFVRCQDCGLAQIDYVVPPELLFYPEYPYRSGITKTLSKNLQSIAESVVGPYQIEKESLVVDIGSNDGTVLQGFKRNGMRVMGIEPTNIAQIAVEENEIPTVQAFFSEALAKQLRAENGAASVVTATNLFAHVAGLGSLMRGVQELLDDGGVFLTESHYLMDLLDTVQYDSIYHEHLKYYSLRPLIRLMSYYNFTLVDVERIPNYGGSIRVFARKGTGHKVSAHVDHLLGEEIHRGLYTSAPFEHFRNRVVQSRHDLQNLVVDCQKNGDQMVGIGCPGRASTLLNYCKVGPDWMPYIAEQSSSLKLGLFLPGTHIPIEDEKRLFIENPAFAIMLSWHYSAPIVRTLREKGLRSKIVLPLPTVQVLDS